MSVQLAPLYAKVLENPGIGAYRLADWLDRPVDEVQAELDKMFRAGGLDEHDWVAPNGRPSKRYTAAGAKLPLDEPTVDSSAPPAHIAAAPQEDDEPDEMPEKDSTPGLTHYERARKFILAQPNRKATGAQLHALLGLKADQYPSTFLKGALDRGWLIKTGKEWFVGLMPEEVKAREAANPAQRSPHIVQPAAGAPPGIPVDDLAHLHASIIQEHVEAGEVVDAELDQPFQCAIWSDGQLQLVRNGETAELLSYDETAILYDYMRRIDLRRPS